MSYLLKKDDQNLVYILHMNDAIYYRTLPSPYKNRLIPMARHATPHYAATLDDAHNMHIVYKSRDHKIIHMKEDGLNFNRTVLLDDANNTYNISNLQLIPFNGHLYLFYTALNPYDETCDLIFHQMDDPNSAPQSLLSMVDLQTSYDLTVVNHQLYLLCITKGDNYELGLYTFSPERKEWSLDKYLLEQNHPIKYTAFCKDATSTLHVVYVTEQFGQNQLNYINTQSLKSKLIHASPYPLEPIVFKYKNYLWVNWIENRINKFSFSMNDGYSFSQVKKATLQNDHCEHIYLVSEQTHLYGSRFYGHMNPMPKLAVLSQIDLENILLHQNLNNELNLLISELQQRKQPTTVEAPQEDVEQLKEIQDSITHQYNHLSSFAKQLQEEGKRWKSKYLKAEAELRRLRDEVKTLQVQQLPTHSAPQETVTPSTSTHQNNLTLPSLSIPPKES